MTTPGFYDFDPFTSSPPRHSEDNERVLHQDIRSLSDEDIASEIVVLTNERAYRVIRYRLERHGSRSRDVWSYGNERLSDTEWIAERLGRLRSEQVRRRSRVA